MIEIDSAAVLWGRPGKSSDQEGTVVLLHGYGSNERELFGRIASMLPGHTIASLRALSWRGQATVGSRCNAA